MTRNQIRNQLFCMQRDGRIDHWKEERGPSGYATFWVQVDNRDEWALFWDEGDV